MNLESPSGAGARLASRPGMSSNSADVTVRAVLSVASRMAFIMMLLMNWRSQRTVVDVGLNGHYKYSTHFICHSSLARDLILVLGYQASAVKHNL